MADRKEDGRQRLKNNFKTHSPHTIRGFQHLKPLSVYSQQIARQTSCSKLENLFCTPDGLFCRVKDELINRSSSRSTKRKLDDSCLDDTYETPLKKVCRPKCHSPDLGCILVCSPESERRNGTPFMSTPLATFRERDTSARLNSCRNLKTAPFSPVPCLEPVLASSPDLGYGSTTETCLRSPLSASTGNREVPNLEFAVPKLVHDVQEKAGVNSRLGESEDMLSVSQQQVNPVLSLLEETHASDSFESTLPIRVQIKSKVVVPNKEGGQQEVRKVDHRPVAFRTEEDWEREKRKYVESVIMHMNENTGAQQGVMGELFHLMNSVAGQKKERGGGPWQHPSDLTCRNYRGRFGGRLKTLDRWQDLNIRSYRRFGNVPKVFVRSPVL